MKKQYYIIFFGQLFWLLFTVQSCKKSEIPCAEPIIDEADTCFCERIPRPETSMNYPIGFLEYADSYTEAFELNPNNGNEFVYTRGVFPNMQLMYYNRSTQEKRVLYNGNISGNISWSVKDWIIFQRSSDFSTLKIKSNGDSLTNILPGKKYFFAEWNFSGEKIMVKDIYSNSYRTRIMDENGVELDSTNELSNHTANATWRHPKFYLGATLGQIILLDVETNSVKKKIIFPEQSEVGILGWVTDRIFWYSVSNRFYSHDISTDVTKVISCECNTIFRYMSATADYSTKIALKLIKTPLADYKINIEFNYFVMDENGEPIEEFKP